MNQEEIANAIKRLKREIVMEKECTIEFEYGCGVIDINSEADFVAIATLVGEGFTDVDIDASVLNNIGHGYVWVC
jgi:hypothetical protein